MNIKSRFSKFAIITGMTLSLTAFTTVAAAANNEHEHGHGEMELQLNDGNKWAVDAPLSRAMNNIGSAMHKDLDAIHSGKLENEKYSVLAKKINNEVNYMVENCNLEPEADAQLHLIIAELMEGATVMESKANARDGAVQVMGAIESYTTYFDDPNFEPIKH
ncbi:hypothetical protein FE845_10995 [Marinobacter sp. 1-4A]|uniref:hypothetical protein n=1 Tax=unclassified Marinobacter TaxID=83889 RepID=UPI001906483D|nr:MULTISPECIES: hypothetical protein [unclassified Marinobacter]MBK1851868.1 hypothetical protein [Marinobacter sp. 1-4A]MCK0164205.1 hypothetical protein [Marinobacter sp. S6332]